MENVPVNNGFFLLVEYDGKTTHQKFDLKTLVT